MGVLSLVCVMYLVVSGGAYGIEDAVKLAGPRLTMLLCVVVPITLSLPTALMAAELTALMPVEGGFYYWVKAALGPFAGFAEIYLTVLYTAVDMAIYPVLFSGYLSFLFPIGHVTQFVLAISLIWISGAMNLAGIRPVGFSSIALTVVLLAPFAIFAVVGIPRLVHFAMPPQPLLSPNFMGALGAGLTVVIWNFGGWENLSVVAGEVEDPRRNYVRAVAVALPMVAAGYIIPLAVAVSRATNTSEWSVGWFAHEGYAMGGPILGGWLALGGGIMALAVFQAAMLWVSRMPYVLAREGYFPPAVGDLWSTTGAPWKAILLCCFAFTLMVPLGFVTLVVLDVFFYMAALALEMAALVRLRRLFPNRQGLFVIGGGKLGLAAVAISPLLTWAATFGLALSQGDGHLDFLIAIALGATVWPVYILATRLYGGPRESSSEIIEDDQAAALSVSAD